MTGSHDVHHGCGTLLTIATATITRAHKRWRIAYLAISSIRFMVFLTKEIGPKRNKDNSRILKAQLYTTLDIEPCSSNHVEFEHVPCSFVPKIDQTILTEIAKEKDIIAIPDVQLSYGEKLGKKKWNLLSKHFSFQTQIQCWIQFHEVAMHM
ncbi:hypothetical protein SO802_032502 [Lithocarpus litseifolius]|uniref:Uncharacterized protein n=1 Tax=Lithocarpus litseifolius TaxID=425828 RepID=A0AAW2BAY1_9ROSI